MKTEKIGKSEYLNENCWLVKNLNYPPADRCKYCKLKFRKCLFFQYLIISLVLILFLFALSFLVEGEMSGFWNYDFRVADVCHVSRG